MPKARRRPFLPAGTELIVWRDPKTPTANAFNCASKPAWFPLSAPQILFFNEQEAPSSCRSTRCRSRARRSA